MTADVDRETAVILERFAFDEPQFDVLRARVASGELSRETNVLGGSIEPPEPDDITRLPAPGDRHYDAMREAGRTA